jgi:hypothetical protein
MAQMYPQFTLTSIHPGVVQTNLTAGATGSNMIVRMLLKATKSVVTSVEKGAKNQLWASVSMDVKSGEYYEPVGTQQGLSEKGRDDELAEQVWDWTERELEAYIA